MATFTEAMTPSETADEVAQGLALENPEKGATTLTKPKVPAGFEVTIDAVSPAGVVNSNWSIQAPDVETRVTVTLRVTRIMDGNAATKGCTVTVPAYTAQEVLNTVTIPQPEKKDEALRLPKVPYGFALEIVSSTDDLIAEDGTVTWPLEDAEVTVKVRVTKRSNDTYAEKEFLLYPAGHCQKLNTPIQADEIDAVKGYLYQGSEQRSREF